MDVEPGTSEEREAGLLEKGAAIEGVRRKASFLDPAHINGTSVARSARSEGKLGRCAGDDARMNTTTGGRDISN